MIKFIIASAKEIIYEVTWPSYKELTKLSNLFLIGLLLSASVVGVINIYLQKVSAWLYGMF